MAKEKQTKTVGTDKSAEGREDLGLHIDDIFAVGRVEAEHSNVFCAEDICIFKDSFGGFNMTVNITVKLDLAKRRADCGSLDSVFVKKLFGFKNFRLCQNGNAFLVDVTNLDVRYAELIQPLKLFFKRVRIFVCKCRKYDICHIYTLISGSSSALPDSSERIIAFIMNTGEMNSS